LEVVDEMRFQVQCWSCEKTRDVPGHFAQSHTVRSHANGCEDDDAHKAVFHELAHEHKTMAASHRVKAIELDASPEVDEFEQHGNGAPEKAISAPFNRREFEKDCDKLSPEMRKCLI
jgi:hypothetical protein